MNDNRLPRVPAWMALVFLAACGGGGSGGPAGGTAMQAMASATPVQLASCGGSAVHIRIGLDANGNGALDAEEVSYTEVVCTSGSDAPLVSVVDEPAGATCAAGGKRVLAGTDANQDGILQVGEITSSATICHGTPGSNGTDGTNGSDGADGTPGTDGTNSLLALATEPAGANCPAGGTRVRSGPDTNRNGALDTAEVVQTAYVCNAAAGADGRNSLIATAAEPVGLNCPHGGHRVQSGLDANANNTLDAAEVGQTVYVCNPPPAGLAWVSISAATQAAANTGYIATATTEVPVTLPADPAIGSVVRITGAGSGGWRLNQLAGQSVQTLSLPVDARAAGQWTLRRAVSGVTGIASSGDGRHLLAVRSGAAKLLVSNDFGVTWAERDADRGWSDVAVDATGQTMLAAGDGNVYRSNDLGATWTQVHAGAYNQVAVSRDGRLLFAKESSGVIWTAYAGGGGWVPGGAVPPARTRFSVSSDGRHLMAPGDWSGDMLVSNNGGASWQVRTTLGPGNAWAATAMSGDGARLWAASEQGVLYRSIDYGATWQDLGGGWTKLAASADGTRLAAISGFGFRLHFSNDSGITWTQSAGGGVTLFTNMACSSDCGRVAAVGLGGIYTSPTTTTVGTAGGLAGAAGASVELQYVGAGGWAILGHAGAVVSR